MHPMTAGDGAAARPGRRAALRPNGEHAPPRGDRQGHPPLGLHDRDGARPPASPRSAWTCCLFGPLPTPAVGDADPLDARRPRRDDLRLAQPLRGQRHQVVRPRRLQALRRARGGDRGADGRRASSALAARAHRPGARGSTTAAAATSSSSRPPSRAACASTGCGWWSTAPTAPPTASRPPCSRSSAPR